MDRSGHTETIAAIATPPGAGGIGVVRVSGPDVRRIGEAVIGALPRPRHACLAGFIGLNGEPIDQGIALYFPGPSSFTGEDVLELQGHGGPVVMELLLQRTLTLGARIAKPGEFTERAFLNGKLDLAQAEAVADLIESTTARSARLALRTLSGTFSDLINALVERVIELRTFIEATLDFPDEEVDEFDQTGLLNQLPELLSSAENIMQRAYQGQLLRDGMKLVIAGAPNAGKSSLLNALAGSDAAIVTHLPGTTRDVLRERISIDGMPIHIADTAGLRATDDPIEREGVRRARAEIQQADQILWLYDAEADPGNNAFPQQSDLPAAVPVTLIRNKIDRIGEEASICQSVNGHTQIALCAKSGTGVDRLRTYLKSSAGLGDASDGEFIARQRHVDALSRAIERLRQANANHRFGQPPELIAEELRVAQQALGEITGTFTPDDLLGRIFTSFCIGK